MFNREVNTVLGSYEYSEFIVTQLDCVRAYRRACSVYCYRVQAVSGDDAIVYLSVCAKSGTNMDQTRAGVAQQLNQSMAQCRGCGELS